MDERLREEVGGLIRRGRRSKQWSIVEMAEAAGVAPRTANNAELGRPTRPGNLRAIMDAVDIPPLVAAPEQTVDKRIQLAMDLVRQWLEALPEQEVDPAVHDLTRFVMLRK
jgi:transcriptional regulator with XRE-family HTH domain